MLDRGPPAHPVAKPVRAARRDRIRVAYLSADFHAHATARLMAGLFARHDRERFETIAVAFGPYADDAMTARLKPAFDRWLDVRRLDDREVAELLEDLEIDIAVDLKGLTDDARPGVLARRPAPVQVSYLGFPGTIGADWIDYIVADPVVIPPEDRAWYTEKVVYLPDSYQVNDDRREIAVRVRRARRSRACRRRVRLLLVQPHLEDHAADVRRLDALLRRVERSVLWLLEGDATARRRTCDARRPPAASMPQRLVFAPRVRHDRHLARHRLADLFLDTLPCNAHTTASDALWAGLPVLTWLGGTFAGRVAASLLHAIGMPELIARHSRTTYLSIAQQLATRAGGVGGASREARAQSRERPAVRHRSLPPPSRGGVPGDVAAAPARRGAGAFLRRADQRMRRELKNGGANHGKTPVVPATAGTRSPSRRSSAEPRLSRRLRSIQNYSMTWSACILRTCGIGMSSARAVFRLITSSEFGRLLDGQRGRTRALENPVDITGRLAILRCEVRAIGHQAASVDRLTKRIHRRYATHRRELRNAHPMSGEHRPKSLPASLLKQHRQPRTQFEAPFTA